MNFNVGDKVRVKYTEKEGIITVIHNGAARIEIKKGKGPITDYYLWMLELL